MARRKGSEELVRRTISIPSRLLQEIVAEVLSKKQAGKSASVSAVICEALEKREREGGEDGS
jgi:metal-responsive CopG/Arc/MetJ family transcriptional regulator